jgi:hypothetical protein
MVALDGNFTLDCVPGTYYVKIHLCQYMMERRDVITNEVLETIMFLLAYIIVKQNLFLLN